MSVEERITLCRFLIKMENQEACCASIGVRDASKFRGKEMTQRDRKIKMSGKSEI